MYCERIYLIFPTQLFFSYLHVWLPSPQKSQGGEGWREKFQTHRGANPRTCHGTSSGLPCPFAELGKRGGRGGGGGVGLTERTVKCAPLPQFLEQTIEVMRLVLQQRVQQSTVKHAPLPQVLREIVEVVLVPTAENNLSFISISFCS